MKNGKKKKEMNMEPDYIDSRKVSGTEHERISVLIAEHKAKVKRKRAA